ncbi:sialidase family protein [Granulicella arctica]|uniref:sialidase family protein n=1 Tax=Granulicella arctica TaxID=940613 RepID=UPI0021E0449B|nr:sialidase family protein [Granulicella arctica]
MIRVCRAVLLGFVLAIAVVGLQAQDGFIFKPGPPAPPDNHASTVVELRNNDVLAAWFGGTKEGASDVVIWSARLHGGAWTAPAELVNEHGVACWNPVLFHTRDGRLWLYYKFGKSPSTWQGARRWSSDEGRTWSARERLPEGILGPIRAKPLVLDDGTVVSGSSVEKDGHWTVWVERSVDGGRTFTKFGPIALPETLDIPDAGALAAAKETGPAVSDADEGVKTRLYPPGPTTVGIIQPTIVSLGGEHLRLYARSKTKAARIAVADSIDNGVTWTQASFIALPNPSAGIDAVRLRNGRVILVFNNSYNKRTPLSLGVSRDGRSFHVFKTLEDGEGQYSYPAMIEAKNGDLLITYSWRRQTIKFVRVPKAEILSR